MAESLIKNPQIQTTVSPFKGKEPESQNLFEKKSPNDLWSVFNVEYSTGKTAFNGDIYGELTKVESQAKQYEDILSSPFSPSLDLLG